jgi:hypothetical protein
MQDIELYRYLLGLESPWTVERVKLDIIGQRVDIWATPAEGLRWACPDLRGVDAAVRPRRGTDVAPSGQLSIQDVFACPATACQL